MTTKDIKENIENQDRKSYRLTARGSLFAYRTI